MKTIYNISTLFILLLTLASCSKDDDTNVQPEPEAVLSSISPTSGPKTTIVTINGNHFGTDPSVVQVYFNDKEADIQSVENTKIVTTVPARAYTGAVKVVVDGTEIEGPEFTYIITDVLVSTLTGSIQGYEDGSLADAKFLGPTDGVFDSQGNLFIVDSGNDKIRKITPEGIVSTFAGSTEGYSDGTGENAQFNKPNGIAIDNQDNLFVADKFNHRIRKITPSGVVSTFAGSEIGDSNGVGIEAKFAYPAYLVLDSQNNIYVSEAGKEKIKKITPEGVVSTFVGNNNQGNADGSGTAAQFYNIEGLTVDSNDNIYVADAANHRIRKITPNGLVTTIAGTTNGFSNGSSEMAQFSYPYDVSVSTDGTVYVLDRINNCIRKISTNGMVSTFAGQLTVGSTDGTGVNAQFYLPFGICMNSEGDLYVLDSGNHRIRKITQE